MLKRVAILVFAGTLFLTPSAYSPGRPGSLQGVVKSATGAPVAGAFVKLRNSERRPISTVISQPQGRFSTSALPSGKYVAQPIGGEFLSDLSVPVEVSHGNPAVVELM